MRQISTKRNDQVPVHGVNADHRVPDTHHLVVTVYSLHELLSAQFTCRDQAVPPPAGVYLLYGHLQNSHKTSKYIK